MNDMSNERSDNPFIAGGAINSAVGRGFFGRKPIFTFVRNSLDSEQRVPILLLGQRRIGKSSILRQLPRHLGDDTICVNFDLQGKANQTLDQVLYGLARAIADAASIAKPSREEAAEDSFVPLFLARALSSIGEPRRLVLLFDEFDVVDPQLDLASTRFVPFLGEHLAGRQIGIVLVMGRRAEEMSEAARAAILKDCVQMQIRRLSERDVHGLIRSLATPPVLFSEAAAAHVHRLAAGHPFCTQLLCNVAWRQGATKDGELVTLEPRDIHEAIQATLELGTNGMSWIYDGAEQPEHRLILSALAETADPLRHEVRTLRELSDALQRWQINLPIADLERAAHELHDWDVIKPDAAGAFRFVVPLLGAWVQRERPLLFMQREARFVNPRSWKNYELGLESVEREENEEAIQHFNMALRVNPAFPEAQISLAEALQRTEPPGSAKVVEAWERAYELRADLPLTPLLDALIKSIEHSLDVSVIKQRYERISELDRGGRMQARAQRAIADRAFKKEQIGSVPKLREAWLLRVMIDPHTEQPKVLRRDWHRAVSGLGALLVLIALVVPQFYSYRPLVIVSSFLTCAIAGVMVSYGTLLDDDPKLKLRSYGIAFFGGGFILGFGIWHYFDRILVADLAAFVVGVFNLITVKTYPKETL